MAESQKRSRSVPVGCNCVPDPFAELPPEARPPSKLRMGKLKKVTCPDCGLNYWTNRSTDLCKDCQKNETNSTHSQ